MSKDFLKIAKQLEHYEKLLKDGENAKKIREGTIKGRKGRPVSFRDALKSWGR